MRVDVDWNRYESTLCRQSVVSIYLSRYGGSIGYQNIGVKKLQLA